MRAPARTPGNRCWRAVARTRRALESYPLVEVEFRELLKRLESNPAMTLPAGQQRPASKITVSRGLFAEAFRNVLYTPEGSAQAPKLIHQLVNGDDRGAGRNRPVGTHGARRRAARRRILPVGDVHRRRTVSLEGCRRDGGRNIRRQLPPRAAARGVQGMAARHCIGRASTADEVGDPDAASLGRVRSGHAAVRRRRSRARTFERPACRDSQQRSSDRQRRSVHRKDVRPVSRGARPSTRVDASCAAANPPVPFVIPGKQQ